MRLEYEICEYNSMHLRQKTLILESAAVFLDYNFSFGIISTLFSYHNYFIEVLVEDESKTLLDIVAFKNGEKLDKYIDQVDLEELLRL